jgi:hypothetical protein
MTVIYYVGALLAAALVLYGAANVVAPIMLGPNCFVVATP